VIYPVTLRASPWWSTVAKPWLICLKALTRNVPLLGILKPMRVSSMCGCRAFAAGVNALRSSPYFYLVADLSQDLAPPYCGVVIDMFAAMHCSCLVPLDDTNLVIVHDASPIFGMGIELA
jgi:hypothetical protein